MIPLLRKATFGFLFPQIEFFFPQGIFTSCTRLSFGLLLSPPSNLLYLTLDYPLGGVTRHPFFLLALAELTTFAPGPGFGQIFWVSISRRHVLPLNTALHESGSVRVPKTNQLYGLFGQQSLSLRSSSLRTPFWGTEVTSCVFPLP